MDHLIKVVEDTPPKKEETEAAALDQKMDQDIGSGAG